MPTLIRVEPAEAKPVSVTHASSSRTLPAASLWSGTPAAVPSLPAARVQPAVRAEVLVEIERKVRRSISPISGMALERLGHAIEYLTDEYAFEAAVTGSAGTPMAGDPTLQAIQLLMSLNRQVYFECPVVEPLMQRIFSHLFPSQSRPSLD